MIIPVFQFRSSQWQSLTKPERALIWALSCFADAAGRNCFPSVSSLCEATGLAKRAVLRALDRIVKKGAAEIMKKPGRPNQYNLNVWLKPVSPEGTTSDNEPVSAKDTGLPVSPKDTSVFSGHEPVSFKAQTSVPGGHPTSITSLRTGNNIYLPFSEKLKSKIMQASPDARIKENQVRGWSDDFRLMVERDKRTLEDLDRIIDMVFNDPFWSTVIRSAGKLREQWNAGKVSLDMKRPAIGHTERKRFAYEINAEKKYAGL